MNTFLYADLVSPKRIARQRTTGWWLGCGLFGLFFFSGPLLRLVDPVAAVVDIGVLSLLLLGLLCGLAVVVVSHWLLGLLWPETWEHAASQRVVQDSTAVNIRGVRRMLSLSSGRQAVLILPEGRFQFRPDSGFSGQASLVLIAAETAKVGMESDSVAGSLARWRNVEEAAQSGSGESAEHREGEWGTGFQLPGGWLLIPVMILVIVLVFWWRRVCHCRQLFFLLALNAPLANNLFIISLLQSLLG